ncbi:hypothetical protein KEM55_008111, partial [Ascosphaera atra]
MVHKSNSTIRRVDISEMLIKLSEMAVASPSDLLQLPDAYLSETHSGGGRGKAADGLSDRLPREICLEVLSHLPRKDLARCLRVSTSWYQMCSDGQLYKEIDTTAYSDEIGGHNVVRQVEFGARFLRHLTLHGVPQAAEAWGRSTEVARCTGGLRTLSVEDGSVPVHQVKAFIAHNRTLEEVSLRSYWLLNKSTVRALKQCPSLQSLDLTGATFSQDPFLEMALLSLPELKDLRLSMMDPHIDISSTMLALHRMNTLETLYLDHNERLSREHLFILFRGTSLRDFMASRDMEAGVPRRLRQLVLSHCPKVEYEAVWAMIGLLPDLRVLDISKCSERINNKILVAAMRTMEKLEVFRAKRCEGLSYRLLRRMEMKGCGKALKELEFSIYREVDNFLGYAYS